MIDRQWPELDSEWPQEDLRAYVRQMGMNPDPREIVPQGVKYIIWPQPRLTQSEIAHARELWRQIQTGERESLNIVIKRRRDPRRN